MPCFDKTMSQDAQKSCKSPNMCICVYCLQDWLFDSDSYGEVIRPVVTTKEINVQMNEEQKQICKHNSFACWHFCFAHSGQQKQRLWKKQRKPTPTRTWQSRERERKKPYGINYWSNHSSVDSITFGIFDVFVIVLLNSFAQRLLLNGIYWG